MTGRAVVLAAAIAASAFSLAPFAVAAPAATTVGADAWENAFNGLSPLLTNAIRAEGASASAFDPNWRSKRQQLRRIVLRARSAWAALRARVRTLPDGSKDEDAVTALLEAATTKYINSNNAYLRAFRTERISDVEAGDRLARQGDDAIAAARRVINSLYQPATNLERDLVRLADLVQANRPLITRGDAIYADMIRALRKGGISDRDGAALKDAIAVELVYRQIGRHLANARPYQTPEVQALFNTFRRGFGLVHAASNDYVAGLRTHRLALLRRGDVKWQRGEALRAQGLKQLAVVARKATG
jgi:hypothetical protein